MADTKQDRLGGPGPGRDGAASGPEGLATSENGRTVEAYEEDWYRSLKALAERRSSIEEDDELAPEGEPAANRPAEAETSEGVPEPSQTADAVSMTSAPSELRVEESEGPPMSDEASDASDAAAVSAPAQEEAPPETVRPSAVTVQPATPIDHARERRLELAELVSGPIGELEAARLAALALDPDPEVRRQALTTLAGHAEYADEAAIARALDDPVDDVRAAAVRLAAESGTSHVSALARLVGERRWPLTQRTVLEVLPAVFDSGTTDGAQIEEILEAIGQLKPGPNDDERALLGTLGGAIGTEELIARLAGPDDGRLGAVRLLADDGSDAARRALAALVSDPVEEIRNQAVEVVAALGEDKASSGPVAPAPTSETPIQTEQSERVGSLALSLSDPDGAVRHLALSGLGGIDRASVLTWVRSAISSQDRVVASAAIATTALLGLDEVSADVIDRAADLARPDPQQFVERLASSGVEVERLVGLLIGVEESRRPAAIGMMWDVLGARFMPFVRGFVTHPSVACRLAAVDVLGRSGDPDAASLAATVIRNDLSPIVRAAAIRATARLGDPTTTTSIREALTDPDAEVRMTAVEALPQPDESEAVGLLVEALSDVDERVRRAAALRLALTSNNARDLVWQALLMLPSEERGSLIETIERANPGGLSDLALEALRSLDHDERLLAAEVVGRGLGQACVEAAIHALLDPQAAVRRAATEALARLKDPSAAGALGKALVDPDAEVRLGVVRALGVIDDEAVLGFLVSALSDPDAHVRQAASEVLTEWSSPAVAKRLAGVLAVPALRGPASDLLTRMGPTCVELLIDVLIQGHPGVAPTVGELLKRIVGLDELITRLDSIEPDRRLRAVEAVGAIGGDDAVDVLIRTLSDPDERIRIRSSQLLGELGSDHATRALQAALGDPVPSVLAAVEEALSRLAGQALAAGM